MRGKRRLDAVERWNALLALCAVAVSGALASVPFTLSLITGVSIEAVNYRVLRRAADRLFAGELRGGRVWAAGYSLRFLFVGAAMAVALRSGADPVALVIGLSTVVPAAVTTAWRSRPSSASTAPAAAPDDPAWERWNPWLARERDDAEEDEV